jgi:hypothetical protein
MMKKKSNLVVSTRRGSALLVGGVLGLLAGCGDADVFKINAGAIDTDSSTTEHVCFNGSAIKLVRYSSACARTSKSLVSEVHEGMVFSADDVGTLSSPCAYGPTPAIEVYFDSDSHSIYFDFSQVTHGDRFPDADFEGYMFEIVLEEANGFLVAVTVDQEGSNLDIDRSHIESGKAHIDVNFEGVAYDHQGLLKLDLLFARVSPLPN